MTLQDKFAATRKELAAKLIEREIEIDLALTAIACKEHFVMVGPAGVVKSLLCDAILGWLDGPTFSRLFSKFTQPEEVFGSPTIIKETLSDGSSRTRIAGTDTKGMLPEAVLAFTDELFNGSSAVLNTTLKLLNERTFVNDGGVLKCPLWTAFAGSNLWPNAHDGGKELEALFDRFILRKEVRPIGSESGRDRLIWVDNHTPSLSTRITPEELWATYAEVSFLTWTDDAKEAFMEILRTTRKEGIVPGDRRSKKSRQVAQAYAWVDGADQVTPEHLEILTHTLWVDPAEQPQKLATIVSKIASPVGLQLNGLRIEAEQIISSVDVKDVGEVIGACGKLSEIAKQLAKIDHPRAKSAHEHVASAVQKLKLQAVSAV